MIQKFKIINSVNGILNLPGDKSISHRSVMFASMAEGKSEIYNYLKSEDIDSTISAFKMMGCSIEVRKEKIIVNGRGFGNLRKPETELYLGNSGTTTRLLTGILAAQKFDTKLTGDDSLSKRPMARVINPLTEMGADIRAVNGNLLPLSIKAVEKLNPMEYELPVASAQVKSAVLLAGLHLESETCVIEKIQTRNHTENMLGLRIENSEGYKKIYSSLKNYPKQFNIFVPSDISTAAFFIVFALLAKNSEIMIKNVSLNETRAGILEILVKMGGNIQMENVITESGEKRGDLVVKSSALKNIPIPAEIIANIIDEIPILAIAGVIAEGNFEIRGAEELRFKESDRISSICSNLKLLGLDINEFEDGFRISGKINNKNIMFQSFGDHRIAMAFSVLSSLIGNDYCVKDFECVSISNPDFLMQLNSIGV